MASKAFNKIMAGVEDMRAHINGDTSRGRERKPAIVRKVNVAEIRASLGLSQTEFATGFGVNISTLRNWEQGRRAPEGPALVLLTLIQKDPSHVIKTIWPQKEAR